MAKLYKSNRGTFYNYSMNRFQFLFVFICKTAICTKFVFLSYNFDIENQ